MAQARGNAAAADPHRHGAGAIRLAPDAPSGRQRAGICRLRWVYVCTALLWLRVVDGVKLTHYDWAGAAIALCGMLIIVAGWGRA